MARQRLHIPDLDTVLEAEIIDHSFLKPCCHFHSGTPHQDIISDTQGLEFYPLIFYLMHSKFEDSWILLPMQHLFFKQFQPFKLDSGVGYETRQSHRFQWLLPWPAKSAWEFGGTLHGKLQGISSMNVLGYTPLRNNICRALVMLPPYGRGRRHPWRRQVALS